jgi:hypothetical protein|tara:strand:+ start:92 stop:670 length:579 start_codon:yes stop_codon:yes gene_type:complete
MLSHDQQLILKQNQDILKLKQREERYAYIGLLSEYQLHPPSLIQALDYTKLNPYQHFLFKRVLHGLNMYDKTEIEKMHWDKKRRVKKVWRKGQEVLNEFKQYVCYKDANQIFSIFKHSPLAQGFLDTPFEYVPSIRNKMTLKEVNLTYEDVIIKFMEKGLLPKNFLSLKPHGNQKSFTKNGSKKQRVQQVKA